MAGFADISKIWLGLSAAACGLVLTFALAVEVDFGRMKSIAEARYGISGSQAVADWETFLGTLSSQPTEAKVIRINAFFNEKIFYGEDLEVWQVADHWATPLETLALGRGDCEDFAFAKYVSLQLLGVPAEQLRLTYVRAKIAAGNRTRTQAHMVLSYYPAAGAEPLILDSLNQAILPASARKDLYPIFSFNTEELWVTGQGSPTAYSSARLSHWRDVLSRMHDEGIRRSSFTQE